MVSQHVRDALQDHGGASLKPAQTIGDLPQRRHARAAQGGQGNDRCWIHVMTAAPLQGNNCSWRGQWCYAVIVESDTMAPGIL